MLLSIIVYCFIIFAEIILFHVKTYKIDNQIYISYPNNYKVYYCLGILILVFFLAVRWDVGRDYQNYLQDYIAIINTGEQVRSDVEPGFVLLMKFFAKHLANSYLELYIHLVQH